MESKKKKTSSAVGIMHKRYIKGNKRRLKHIDKEGQRLKIAQQIYDLRTKAGLTQKEFAKRVGMKQSAISRLESTDYRGCYRTATLGRIAKAMNKELQLNFVPKQAYA